MLRSGKSDYASICCCGFLASEKFGANWRGRISTTSRKIPADIKLDREAELIWTAANTGNLGNEAVQQHARGFFGRAVRSAAEALE